MGRHTRWLLATMLLASCTYPRTEIDVRVDTDLAWGAGAAMQSLRIELRVGGAVGEVVSQRTVTLNRGVDPVLLPLTFAMSPRDQDATRRVWIQVHGCHGSNGCGDDVGEAPLVTQRALVSYVRRETRRLDVFLASRCVGVTCSPSQRCDVARGVCVAAEVPVEQLRPVPQFDAGLDVRTVDANVDARTVDARIDVHASAIENVDLLFEVDNSSSMRDNQIQLAVQFDRLISQLISPPIDPITMTPRFPPVTSLRVGVVSTDLGTPGSQVPSCANSDLGDDGQLNPIRRGLAIRNHQPWVTAPTGVRPARCTMDRNQYPIWLEFDLGAARMDANYVMNFRDDFVCNAFLSVDGCGLEQQLEAAYRALIVHDARERPGNSSPNAGFVRDDAVLAIVVVTDEEDGSARDCRYAEGGRSCVNATSVFNSESPGWSSTGLNLRFYMYSPGSEQDPTWPVDRYIDPTDPNRGFTALKPGHPQRVIFAAIAGVPIDIPLRVGSTEPEDVDWDALLSVHGMSAEGEISMQQAQMDRHCPSRVVPACRRQGTSDDPLHPNCDTAMQYFAWPSRRIVQVARGFAETYGNGIVSSICRTSYEDGILQIASHIRRQLH